MSLTTTIKWREYPAEKPPTRDIVDSFICCIHVSGNIRSNIWNGQEFVDLNTKRPQSSVTHFALPEDIITQELT